MARPSQTRSAKARRAASPARPARHPRFDLDDPKLYVNRGLSMLQFFRRVQPGKDEQPLDSPAWFIQRRTEMAKLAGLSATCRTRPCFPEA